MSDWIYHGQVFEGPPDKKDMGFVYLISHPSSGKKYIGRKLFWCRKTKQVKGKKKRILAESDWRTYWSSSDELQEWVVKDGEDAFVREMLWICPSKGMMNYLEAREQMDRRVLENQSIYLNKQIQVRVHHTHIKRDYCA